MTPTRPGAAPATSSAPAANETHAPAPVGTPDAQHRTEIESLYACHARMVYAVALGYLSAADAEDVVQDVFLRAMHRLDERRDPERSGPWLAAIARSVAIDWHRHAARDRRKNEAMKHDPTRPPATPGASPGDAADEAAEVLAAIRRLPEAYREPLILRLVEGLTGPQIADLLGMTHGSVRVNLCHGMHQLRTLLGWEGAQ